MPQPVASVSSYRSSRMAPFHGCSPILRRLFHSGCHRLPIPPTLRRVKGYQVEKWFSSFKMLISAVQDILPAIYIQHNFRYSTIVALYLLNVTGFSTSQLRASSCRPMSGFIAMQLSAGFFSLHAICLSELCIYVFADEGWCLQHSRRRQLIGCVFRWLNPQLDLGILHVPKLSLLIVCYPTILTWSPHIEQSIPFSSYDILRRLKIASSGWFKLAEI